MTPRHHQLARETAISILAALESGETLPGHIVLAKYESQLDYETLRPEDKPARFEDHTEMIDTIATTILPTLKSSGIQLTTPVINASDYLRWLAANGRTNTANNRAEFVSNPSA